MFRALLEAIFPNHGKITKIENSVLHGFDENWLYEEFGALHLDFPAISERARLIDSPNKRSGFLTSAVTEWVWRYSQILTLEYEVMKSPHFVVLAPLGCAKGVAQYAEESRKTVEALLSKVAINPVEYPVAILGFQNIEDYYSYLQAFYTEDEKDIAGSGGMFVGDPHNHQIIFHNDFFHPNSSYTHIVAHELSHCLLTHLELPLWIDEGITQNVEESCAGAIYSEVLSTRELPRKNRALWNYNNIETFWTGEAFFRNETQECAYYFAKVLINLILCEICRSPGEIVEFVTKASREDAGEAAFSAVFEQSIGVLIEEILGGESEKWKPDLKGWS